MCTFKLFAVFSVLLSLVHVCRPAPGTLRVATCDETYAPFVLMSEVDGSLYGLEIEEVNVQTFVCRVQKQISLLCDMLSHQRRRSGKP